LLPGVINATRLQERLQYRIGLGAELDVAGKIRVLFIDQSAGELVVRPKISYQIMLGTFSSAFLVFGIWWMPIIEWTQSSLTFLQRG
jgi:hypothetical protein